MINEESINHDSNPLGPDPDIDWMQLRRYIYNRSHHCRAKTSSTRGDNSSTTANYSATISTSTITSATRSTCRRPASVWRHLKNDY